MSNILADSVISVIKSTYPEPPSHSPCLFFYHVSDDEEFNLVFVIGLDNVPTK